MAKVKPFKGVRPPADKAHLVASRSYVSYTRPQLRSKLYENPYSFLHIIHPDMGSTKLHKTASHVERFELVRKKYADFIHEDILIKDLKDSFYIYRQIKNGHPFTGIIAAVAVEDYLNGKIKIHEQTLSKREETFTTYLDITDINAEPVLLMSPRSNDLEKIYARYLAQRPEYDFTTTNKDRHQLWVINQESDIQEIENVFSHIDALYIADGHHRSASSASLCKKRNAERNGNGSEPWNYFLGYILDENTVRIFEFNRLVKDLNGLSEKEFLKALEKDFYVNLAPNHYKPVQKGEFSLYMDKLWYNLTVKVHTDELDAQVLSDLILGPILNIKDLRKDKRISFLDGPKGMEGLKHAVDKNKFKAGFGLFPVAISELKNIADNQGTMPPKSTYVEPKLRSGLVVYETNV
jgi:uncharacterized protein (DUF1015 family)